MTFQPSCAGVSAAMITGSIESSSLTVRATGDASGLSTVRTVPIVVGQHALIALDNAAACILAANFSAASGVREPRARKAGRHAPLPHPTSGVALDLVHVANMGVPEAVALAPRLVFIKAGPIALKPVAARPSL
jgi:hypothetical protein